MSNKSGRLNREEMGFIRSAYKKMPVEEIAKKLNRSIHLVKKYIATFDYEIRESQESSLDIKTKPYWRELKEQFSPRELELIDFHYSEIMAQFKNDVLPLEIHQVLDVIKLTILCDRCLREQNDIMIKIGKYEEELKKSMEVGDRDQAIYLERLISSLRAAKETLSREYKELFSRKSTMFRDLKATRDQRISKIESGADNFPSFIARVLKDPEFNEKCSLEMERFRLAVEEEKKRLSDWHQYNDGTLDLPLINHENIMKVEE